MRSKRTPEKLVYVYGITREPVGPKSLPVGIDGRAMVKVFPSAELLAFSSEVDAREFGDELTRNMDLHAPVERKQMDGASR